MIITEANRRYGRRQWLPAAAASAASVNKMTGRLSGVPGIFANRAGAVL